MFLSLTQAMETNDMAKAIGDNLQDAGFKGADVQPADAAPATVEISQEPVVQANQPIGGASFEQAQTDDFQVMHTLSFPPSFIHPDALYLSLNQTCSRTCNKHPLLSYCLILTVSSYPTRTPSVLRSRYNSASTSKTCKSPTWWLTTTVPLPCRTK